MDKFIKVSRDAAFGVRPLRHSRARQVTAALEKRSEDLTGQMNWLEQTSRIDPRLVDWVRDSNLDHDSFTYVLVVPLGADESWEETVNGDAFERKWLEPVEEDWGHDTFRRFAKAFMHHKNNDPSIGFGDLPAVCFNGPMDRVEAIWRLDHDKAKEVGGGAWKFIQKVRNGEPADISMGCRVPFDICTICGNEAKNPAFYCQHVWNPGFGWICPTSGEKMRLLNPKPKFFDLSGVTVAAAPESAVLGHLFPELAQALARMKTSSVSVIPSALVAAQMWGTKTRLVELQKFSSPSPVSLKLSDIIKEAPVLDTAVIRPMRSEEEDLSVDEELGDSVSKTSLPAVLSTLAALGIPLSPDEYCDVIPAFLGGPRPTIDMHDVRDAWDWVQGDSNLITPLAFSHGLAAKFRKHVPGRSFLFPHLAHRVQRAPDRPSSPPSSSRPKLTIIVDVDGLPAAAAYANYIKTLCKKFASLLRTVIQNFPEHIEDNIMAGDLTADGLKGSASREKLTELPMQAALPSAYLLSMVDKASSPYELQRAINSMNTPEIAHLVGGVVRSSAL